MLYIEKTKINQHRNRGQNWELAHFPNYIVSRHDFKSIYFTNISSLKDSFLGYKSSLKDSVFMV